MHKNYFVIIPLLFFFNSCTTSQKVFKTKGALSTNLTPCRYNKNFNIGLGIYDITGTPFGRGMMGYASFVQKTAGIHTRLRSRAFLFESPCNNKKFVFVSADLGQVFQSVKQAVIEKLVKHFGDGVFGHDNVMISATHTHSGPGGYSKFRLFNLSLNGFDQKNFDTIVDGIFLSIVRAYKNKKKGSIEYAKSIISNVSKNRSPEAYSENDSKDPLKTIKNTDESIFLLKFKDANKKEIGMLNWFAVHPTNLGNTNQLISGDNKGLASYYFERSMKTNYKLEDTFVAGFAQSNEGDVTGNLIGPPNGIDDFKNLEKSANLQFVNAKKIFNGATQSLSGGIEYRNIYLDFTKIKVAPKWSRENEEKKTCEGTLGLTMTGGSHEDGGGIKQIKEGVGIMDSFLKWINPFESSQLCHQNKILFLDVTSGFFPKSPKILPIQIAVVGNLALIGLPFEVTTMAGRRIRQAALNELKKINISEVVIAGLSNSYAGYITTKEEYRMQHYEGGSTYFGPLSSAAIVQTVDKLSQDIVDSRTTTNSISPKIIDFVYKQTSPRITFDHLPLETEYGDIHTNVLPSYKKGSTVSATFWAANPNNNFRTQKSYLHVEQLLNNVWVPIYFDWDSQTKYHIKRHEALYYLVTIEWKSNLNQSPGKYRLVHIGDKKDYKMKLEEYRGYSFEFNIY